jgi:3-oxocholest-4-en-26-oyl-CoA dehydrogenase alpha subunit
MMDFSRVPLDASEREFLDEVRSFMAEHVTGEVLEEERRTGSGFNERVHLALGARGWIMPTWPAERGGAGLDPVRARILELEMRRAGVPSITHGTTRLVLAAVEKSGRPDLVAELLPGVAAGTVRFCLGYTEPDGGSDIAAAKTRAVRDGDEWVINGSKIFTTGAQNCQYVFLITRTDPELPKHRGLTMFLVPLASPGVEIQAIRTFGGERTNIVYYSDVRISDRYRLGGVNDGWSVLHGPLDEEHGVGRARGAAAKVPGLVSLGDLSIGTSFLQTLGRAIDSALAWACTTTRADGSRPIDDRLVRYRLGAVAMHMEAGLVTPGPMGRVKGSDALVHGAADLMDLVGPASLLSEGSPGADLTGVIDYAHRFAQGTATYGGTVEVFHGIIAQHVLGLPRPSYPGSKTLAVRKREQAAALTSRPAREQAAV